MRKGLVTLFVGTIIFLLTPNQVLGEENEMSLVGNVVNSLVEEESILDSVEVSETLSVKQVLSTVKPVTDEVVKVEKTTNQVVKNVVGEAAKSNPSMQAITNEVQKTEQNTNKLVQDVVKEVTKPNATVNAVTDEVNKITNQTLTGVKEVLSTVTNTTNITVNEIVGVVDETVNSLPEVPAVTPVLKETTTTLKNVTTKVQDTVSAGDEGIKETIDSIENVLALPPPKMQDTEKPTKVIETNKPVPVTQLEPTVNTNLSDLVEETGNKMPGIEVTKPEKSREPVVIEASLEDLDHSPKEPVVETVEEPVTKEILIPLVTQSTQRAESTIQPEAKIIFEKSVELEEPVKSQTPKFPVKPAGPHAKVMLNSSPVFSGHTQVNNTSHSLVIGHDVLSGLLPSQEMMKELKRKKWYHKNSYAIIQWFHTPLRKPPEVTPFLYVI